MIGKGNWMQDRIVAVPTVAEAGRMVIVAEHVGENLSREDYDLAAAQIMHLITARLPGGIYTALWEMLQWRESRRGNFTTVTTDDIPKFIEAFRADVPRKTD